MQRHAIAPPATRTQAQAQAQAQAQTRTQTHHWRRRASGFTLIELMITLAIVAILTAVAYPAYTEQVARGKRAEARTVLLEAAQWMERFYSENYRYDQNTAAVDADELFAAAYTQVPASGTKNYDVALANLAARTFRVVATRSGSMAADKCGDFVVAHTGAKGLANFDTGVFANEADAVAACWR